MRHIIVLVVIAVISSEGNCQCPGHEIEIYNGCPFPIWPAVFSPIQPHTNTGFRLEKYAKRSIQVPCKWEAARIWARTDCDQSGRNCETGDCGQMVCQGAGQADVTLAEMTLDGGTKVAMGQGNDVYDISAVDAFNLPIDIYPVNGVKIGQQFGFPAKYDCVLTQCKYDFRNNCPDELKKWKNGKVASCLSACTAKNNDWFCCRGQYNSATACKATRDEPLVRFFKNKCPDIYSFAYDDQVSTFHCQGYKGTKYVVSFCPA